MNQEKICWLWSKKIWIMVLGLNENIEITKYVKFSKNWYGENNKIHINQIR